jgi:hypothetical protein
MSETMNFAIGVCLAIVALLVWGKLTDKEGKP